MILIALPLLTGCIKRRLIIEVEPKDARVFLDGRELEVIAGSAREPFTFYGGRQITVRRLGRETRELLWRLDRPMHSTFPFDLFTELLWPGEILDERRLRVRLPAAPKPSREAVNALIERAEAVAKEADAEYR